MTYPIVNRQTGSRFLLILGVLTLSACQLENQKAEGEIIEAQANNIVPIENTAPITLSFDFPDSLTGGITQTSNKIGSRSLTDLYGRPCQFDGTKIQDPFLNGHNTSQFLISATATWTCVADSLIRLSTTQEPDNTIHYTGNRISSSDYVPELPTHYVVSEDSSVQTSIKLFFGYSSGEPPETTNEPEFYISWIENGAAINGRMIIDPTGINPEAFRPTDPVSIRLDFSMNSSQQSADVFFQYDENNPLLEGVRLEVTKNLSPDAEAVYIASGKAEFKKQLINFTSIEEIPELNAFAVANSEGFGGVTTTLDNFAFPIVFSSFLNNSLGDYLISKTDNYTFGVDIDGVTSYDWTTKQVNSAIYQGGRTTPETGGTWEYYNLSLDMIIPHFALSTDYFTGSKCAVIGDSCVELINGVFDTGWQGYDEVTGTDPEDWRSIAIQNPVFLSSIYPNSIDWTDAFVTELNP